MLWKAGPMLRTHRDGKRPGGCWGWGLGSIEQKGSRHALHPWSQGLGDLTWEPSRFPGPSGWGKRPPLLSCSSRRVPPLPLLFSPRSPSYAPRTNVPMGRGRLWRAGDWPGSSAVSPGLSGWGNYPLPLSSSSPRARPTCLS